MAFTREVQPDGAVRLTGCAGRFLYRKLAPSVLLVQIDGRDTGEFGSATTDEIAYFLTEAPLELFIDARSEYAPPLHVSEHWTEFLRRRAASLRRVHVLTGSKFVWITVSIAKHFTRTDELIRVYTERPAFESALDGALGRGPAPAAR